MSDIFQTALQNFVKNFGYGDAVRHLFRRGYTVDRILREFNYPYSREELEKIQQETENDSKKQEIPKTGALRQGR